MFCPDLECDLPEASSDFDCLVLGYRITQTSLQGDSCGHKKAKMMFVATQAARKP